MTLSTPALNITSTWSDLTNPQLDPSQIEGGEAGVAAHASTIMRSKPPDAEDGWASVRVDGRDWARVLGVGRMGGRVVACFCHEFALVLYVYLGEMEETGGAAVGGNGGEEGVLTYYVRSYMQ